MIHLLNHPIESGSLELEIQATQILADKAPVGSREKRVLEGDLRRLKEGYEAITGNHYVTEIIEPEEYAFVDSWRMYA